MLYLFSGHESFTLSSSLLVHCQGNINIDTAKVKPNGWIGIAQFLELSVDGARLTGKATNCNQVQLIQEHIIDQTKKLNFECKS